MPTFTHNRVKNGVNGKQYNNMHPGNLFQRKRVSSNPANGKFASNVVTGRSFAAKRAIARRVARQMPVKPLGEEGRRDDDGNIIVTECCNLPTVTISRPVQKYRTNNLLTPSTSGSAGATSATGSVITTITGTWSANSPISIPFYFTELITVNWNNEATQTYQPDTTGFKIISHDFPNSGDKKINISVASSDKVSFGYGDLRTEAFKNRGTTQGGVLAGGLPTNSGINGDANIYTALKSLEKLPPNYRLGKGDVKNASQLTYMDITNCDISEDVSDLFAGTGLESIIGLDIFGKKLAEKGVKKMNGLFKGSPIKNKQDGEDIDVFAEWDLTTVEEMDFIFADTTNFNGDISNWDMPNIKSMEQIFNGAEKFDQDIGEWGDNWRWQGDIEEMMEGSKFAQNNPDDLEIFKEEVNRKKMEERQNNYNQQVSQPGFQPDSQPDVESTGFLGELVGTLDESVRKYIDNARYVKDNLDNPNEATIEKLTKRCGSIVRSAKATYDTLLAILLTMQIIEEDISNQPPTLGMNTASQFVSNGTWDFFEKYIDNSDTTDLSKRIYDNPDGNNSLSLENKLKTINNASLSPDKITKIGEFCSIILDNANGNNGLKDSWLEIMPNLRSAVSYDIDNFDTNHFKKFKNSVETDIEVIKNEKGTIHWAVKTYFSIQASTSNERKRKWNRKYPAYGFIEHWNLDGLRNLEGLFKNKEDFNENIINWDTSSVINMKEMFMNAYDFNKNISIWNIRENVNMENMFKQDNSNKSFELKDQFRILKDVGSSPSSAFWDGYWANGESTSYKFSSVGLQQSKGLDGSLNEDGGKVHSIKESLRIEGDGLDTHYIEIKLKPEQHIGQFTIEFGGQQIITPKDLFIFSKSGPIAGPIRNPTNQLSQNILTIRYNLSQGDFTSKVLENEDYYWFSFVKNDVVISAQSDNKGSLSLTGTGTRPNKVGNNLTAVLSDVDGININNVEYKWIRSSVNTDLNNYEIVQRGDSNTYTLVGLDAGKYITVLATYKDNKQIITVDMSPYNGIFPIDQITPDDEKNTSIVISGDNVTEQTLTATLTDENNIASGEIVKFKWTKTKDNVTSDIIIKEIELQDISNSVADNYTIQIGDVGSQIRVKVSYRDMGGNVYDNSTSAPTETIKRANIPGVLTFNSNEYFVGDKITVALTDENGIDTGTSYNIKWSARDSNNNEDIKSESNLTKLENVNISSTYTIENGDLGKYIYFKIEYTDSDGYTETIERTTNKILYKISETQSIASSINPTPTYEFNTIAEDLEIYSNYPFTSSKISKAGTNKIRFSSLKGNITYDNIKVKLINQDGDVLSNELTIPEFRVNKLNLVDAGFSSTNDGTALLDASGSNATFTLGTTIKCLLTDSEGENAVNFKFTWYRIEGETASVINLPPDSQTYRLVSDDIGKRIKCSVSYTDGGGNPEQMTTWPSPVIREANNLNIRSATDTYRVDTRGNADYPTLFLEKGITYTINLFVSGHPFRIQTNRERNNAAFYNTGLSHSDGSEGGAAQDKESGTLTFTVPLDAPDTLYYRCSLHENMIGTINVINPVEPNKLKIYYEDDRLNTIVNESTEIIESLITTYKKDYNITIEFKDMGADSNTIASASYQTQKMTINSRKFTDINSIKGKINDREREGFTSTFVHELFHIFEVVATKDEELYDITSYKTNDVNHFVYIGTQGLAGYKELITTNNIPGNTTFSLKTLDIENMVGVPIEDDFGPGTEYYHWEEGLDGGFDANGNRIVESRRYDGKDYPILRNEIMTGLKESNNSYITPMTSGALKDVGHIINDSSIWITQTGENMNWV